MPFILTPDDLAPFADIPSAKAQAMIDDAVAMAALVAPCINAADFANADVARAVIRGAILRWHEAGSGAAVQQTAGPYSQTIDNRQTRRGMFWPSEITQLQNLCGGASSSRSFEVDTMPAPGPYAAWRSV